MPDARIQFALEQPDILSSLTRGIDLAQQIKNAPILDRLLQQRETQGQQAITHGQQAISEGEREESLEAIQLQGQVGTALLGMEDIEDRRAFLARVAPRLVQAGIDPEQINSFPIDNDELIRGIVDVARTRLTNIPAEQQTFEALIADFASDEQKLARRVEAGLKPRAVGSGAITTATQPGLTEEVAGSQEIIRQRTKFAEMTGSSRAKRIDKAFETIANLNKNIRNLDRATAALREGASTGAVKRFFPSIREATVKLNQVQGELALDVIGAVTFGALSKGELDLAKAIALPTGLQPDALLEHLEARKAAQEKLRQWFLDQIDFLDQGGSIAGFLRQQQRTAGAVQTAPPTAGTAAPTSRAGGQIMEDAQGNRARVFPDGTFEEL